MLEEGEYGLSDFLECISPTTPSCIHPTSEDNYWVFESKEEDDEDCPQILSSDNWRMQGEGDYYMPDSFCYSSPPTPSFSHPMIEVDYLWDLLRKEEEDKDCPDQTKTLSSCDLTKTRTVNSYFKEYLLSALGKHSSNWENNLAPNFLIQFWAPKTIGGLLLLTTSHQPFALRRIERGLCEYRKHCINLKLNVNDDDPVNIFSEDAFTSGTAIGQVFRHELKESCLPTECYFAKEYPQCDFALKSRVRATLVLPVLNPSGRCCAGVVEFLVTASRSRDIPLDLILRAKNLSKIKESTEEDTVITDEINKALKVVCTTHKLPLAQIWITCCTSPDELCYFPYLSCSDKFSSSDDDISIDYQLLCVHYFFRNHAFRKGQGVVGKALLNQKPAFCRDLTKLPIAEYPIPISERINWLTGCYAICLHSTLTRNHSYVLEFFLPPNWNTISGDPQTFLKLLSATAQNRLPGYKICSGEGPFVEVGKTQTTSVQPTPESFANEREKVQNQVVVGETVIDNGSDILGLKQTGMVVEKTVEISRSDNGKEVLKEFIVEAATNDEITTALSPMPESSQNETEVVKLLDEESTTEAVRKNEVSEIKVVQLSDDKSTEETVIHNESNVVVAEQINIGATSSEKICRVETSEIVHETNELSREDLKQNLGKKLDDVVDSLRVSKNESNVRVAEQSSVPVTFSGRISSRAEALEESEYTTTANEISCEDLKNCFGMKLDDVSKHFGVSRSSIQRVCRKHGIKKWPGSTTKKVNASSTSNLKHGKEIVPKKRRKVNPSCSHTITNVTSQQAVGTVTTKVTYRGDIVRFDLPFASRKSDLIKKVTQRLPLNGVSFNIKYRDEENDWILIACDEDLEKCITISRSLGKCTMSVLPITSCESPLVID